MTTQLESPPFYVIIPARMASTRLPGKPLADIAGKPMVVRVAERAQASGAAKIWVATDDTRIVDAVSAHGYQALLTATDCPSGTDRLAEVVSRVDLTVDAIVVNVQGDEPLIEPELIRNTARLLADHSGASMATLCHPLHDYADMLNPNVVKVILDHAGYALYFSRAPIPWARDAWADPTHPPKLPEDLPVYRHIGLYAYRAGFLCCYPYLTRPAMERFESLEQLRALWHGYRIIVQAIGAALPAGVDTPQDLARVRALYASMNKN